MAIRLVSTAAVRPPWSLPKNIQFLRLWKHLHNRKRWLLLGHPEAGWRSAVIYSMIGSCRQRGLNPQEYLTDVLRRLPGLKTHQLEPLLPYDWKPPTLNSS